MTSADGIRKFGFRRWYERQLIESHAYLVTGFMSLILAIACMEEFSVRGSVGKALLMIVLIAGAGMLCWVTLKRYKVVLERAERLAEQSVCGQCGVYGVLRLVAARSDVTGVQSDERSGEEVMTVECRKCGHRWTMSSGEPAAA
jgi:hypothetical protein